MDLVRPVTNGRLQLSYITVEGQLASSHSNSSDKINIMAIEIKRIIIIVNTVVVSAMVGGGAILKILKMEKITNDFSRLGVGEYTRLLGVSELIILGLLLYPKTMRIGYFLSCAYFGGAMATHLSHHDMLLLPAIPLFFICLNVFLRDQYLFKPSSDHFITN